MREPTMHINVPPKEYLEQFYNKCHGDDGRFCDDEGGKGKLKGRFDDSEGLDWSMNQGQDLSPDKRSGTSEQKTPRWTPENERQAEALDRLKNAPMADESVPGVNYNKSRDWIHTLGEVDPAGKSLFNEDKAEQIKDSYPPEPVPLDSIIGSEYAVRRNPVAETIHMLDRPDGPYGRPGYDPIVVPTDDGRYLLVNGNHRVQAAHYYGLDSIDARVMNPDDIRND